MSKNPKISQKFHKNPKISKYLKNPINSQKSKKFKKPLNLLCHFSY